MPLLVALTSSIADVSGALPVVLTARPCAFNSVCVHAAIASNASGSSVVFFIIIFILLCSMLSRKMILLKWKKIGSSYN